jgi:hypothetical protein
VFNLFSFKDRLQNNIFYLQWQNYWNCEIIQNSGSCFPNYNRIGQIFYKFKLVKNDWSYTHIQNSTIIYCNRKESVTPHANSGNRTRDAGAETRQCYHKTKRSGPVGLVRNIPIYLTLSQYIYII